MKKLTNSTLLMLVGAVLVLLGLVLMIVNGNNKTVTAPQEAVLSTEAAKSVVNDKVNQLIELYETPNKVFKVENVEKQEDTQNDGTETINDATDGTEEIELYYTVTNYESVVKSLFNETGIKELESIKFDTNYFVVKEENTTKILKRLPKSNRFLGTNITIGATKVTLDTIQSEVTFTNYDLVDDTLTYYVISKNIKLVKVNNEWLVESFKYSNQ